MIFSLGLSFAAILLAGAVEVAKRVVIMVTFQLVGSTIASAFRKKPTLSIENRDLGQNLSDPVAGLPVVFGTVRIGIHRVYTNTTPVDTDDLTGSNYLWLIGALCHGPVVGIDEIYLDGHQAFTADGRARDAGGSFPDYTRYAAVWKAYGADGQFQVTPLSQTSHAITDAAPASIDGTTKHGVRLTVGSAHGWQTGQVVEVAGCSLLDDGAYNIVARTTTTLDIYVPQGRKAFGSGGTVKLYTPNLSTLFPQWTAQHEGRGIAFIVLRLKAEGQIFPGGVPRVEAVVRGRAVEDTRSPHVRTIANVAQGPARAHYTSTADVTTTTAHGLAVGDIVRITGAAHARMIGDQRVDEIVDGDTFRCYVPVTTLGLGGTVTKLAPSQNPALVIRDFLRSQRYGAACQADEVDDTAFEAEADYCDELVSVAIQNDAVFTNERRIVQIAVASGVATLTTSAPHGYAGAQTARVFGMSDTPAGLNGTFTITGTPDADKITYACAVPDGTYTPPVVQIPGRDYYEVVEEEQIAWVAVVAQQARLALSGVVDPTRDPRTTLEEMVQSCRGKLIYQSGKFRLFIPRPVAIAEELTADDFFGEVQLGRPSADQIANVVRAAFFNPAQSYQADVVEYPPPGKPNQFWEEDNFQVLRQSVDLPFVTNRARAQQIAMVLRRASRKGITLSATVHERCLRLAVGDRVRVTHDRFAFFEKDFWVDGIALGMNGQVQLALSEYDETAFDLEADDDTPFIQDAERPAPVAFVAPTVVASPTETASTGTLTLSITDPQSRVTKVEFATATGNNPLSAYTEASGPPYQRTVTLTDKQSSRIAFRVWYLDANGIEVNIGWPVPFSADQTASLATVSVTPVAYSDRIEYQFSLNAACTFVEVFSAEFASDPGSPMSVEFSGTHVATLRVGDGRTAINLALAASTNWRVTTFVPYDALNKRGTLVTLKTQGAAPAAPSPITATPTLFDATQTQVQIDVVIPNDATITHVRVYRDGIQWGSDIPVPAVNTTQRLTHSGLSPGTSYGFKYKTRNASGVVSTNFSPSLVVSTDPGTLDAPTNFSAERVGFTSEVQAEWDAGANNPEGTLYVIARAPSSGGPFTDEILSTDQLSASFDQGVDETFFYVVRASAPNWTTSANSNEDEVPAVA